MTDTVEVFSKTEHSPLIDTACLRLLWSDIQRLAGRM